MQKAVAIVFLVMMAGLAMVFFPNIIDATHEAQTDQQTDAFTSVTVADGKASIVLSRPLWSESQYSIVSITAPDATLPRYYSYDDVTKTLVLQGMGATTPQDIDVSYEYDATLEYTGLGTSLGIFPFLLIVVLVLALLGSIVFLFLNKR